MNITMINFGGFECCEVILESKCLKNGAGKTTIINAYVFALTGQTLGGFVPRNVTANKQGAENTLVILTGFAPRFQTISREIDRETGTTNLYINNSLCTQKRFEALCEEEGINLPLAVACADVNVLCESGLTSERLRKLLGVAGALQRDEITALQKEKKDVKAKKDQAETYAISNVNVPDQVCEPLTRAESNLMEMYETHMKNNTEPCGYCPVCGANYSPAKYEKAVKDYEISKRYVTENADEYRRIVDKKAKYEDERRNIEMIRAIVYKASAARVDVITYNKRLAELDEQIRALSTTKDDILPEGVEVLTESTAKNGNVKSVCTLLYNGVPLKSVNRGKRMFLCMQILDAARRACGCEEIFPIIVDNAECLKGEARTKIKNVVYFDVSD